MDTILFPERVALNSDAFGLGIGLLYWSLTYSKNENTSDLSM
jgi:hypothetical protein